ncbi:MAG TPA: sugar phosphate nucleotidyltransferase [Symbiobacteriaceae bacterium]|nr:sugar phosphate nucleotidyltransferase [Symbiobacteriaceae bacterium]
MKAVIMAGGEGSRLRPLTCDRPKPLVPVCNRPVLAYILDLLAQHGFQEVFLTLGYKPAALISHFGETYAGMQLHYVVEETPLGTAGGVAALREHLDSTFMVVSGDALTDVDLSALVRFHRENGAVATLAMTRVVNPLEYGVIMTDRAGRIRRFLEKPGWGEVFSDTVNTGIYVLEPSILDGVPAGKMYDFSKDLFPALLQAGAPLYAAVADGYWCDIGDSAAYLQANLDILQGRLRFDPPGRQVVPGVWVEGEVPTGLLVDGAAAIGKGCTLAPGTRLEAGAVLGPGTVTEAGAVLRRSVTWSGVLVGAEAALVGAVVCDSARLGAGAGAFEGAVIGSDCAVGERATVSPGARLWPRTEVAPGARVEVTLVQSPVWSGRVLRQGGMTGRLGSDLFPENALRVGTAFAAVVGGRGPLVVAADDGAAAEVVKQALIAGTLAAGRRVVDIGTTASPVTEFTIGRLRGAGGIHVRAGGDQARVIFYDGAGQSVPRDLQRKLEKACTTQDFHRAPPEAAGIMERLTQAEWLYLEHLIGQVDVDTIREADLTVTLPSGAVWPVLNRWLERLRCRAVATGGQVALELDPLEGTWRLVGASPETMLALEVRLGLLAAGAPGAETAVPIPVTAPRGVETLLRQAGREPVRVRQSDWRPGDPLLAIGRLLEWMAKDHLTQRDVLGHLPVAHTAHRVVRCPWEAKGRVMRRLLEEHEDSIVEMVDGLRIQRPEGWALVLPDPDEPVYRVYTEADDLPRAEALADQYFRRVEELQAP